jgi:hypothetical protein
MATVRFIVLLFVFIGVIASCASAVGALLLMLRYWPLLIAIVLALAIFNCLINKTGVRVG